MHRQMLSQFHQIWKYLLVMTICILVGISLTFDGGGNFDLAGFCLCAVCEQGATAAGELVCCVRDGCPNDEGVAATLTGWWATDVGDGDEPIYTKKKHVLMNF